MAKKKQNYHIIDEDIIDPDLGMKIILRSDSPNWKVQYQQPGRKQVRHSLKTKSKKQAKSEARRIARDLDNGTLVTNTGKKWTIGEVLDARCDWLRKRDRSNETLNDFHRRVRQLGVCLPKGLKTPIQDLKLSVLEAFESKLRTDGVATSPAPWAKTDRVGKAKPQQPKTVHDAMKAVRTLMKFARDRGWLSHDPAAGYEYPKREVGPIIVFSADELSKIYADDEDNMGVIWRFYTQTCLRAKELIWLLKDDVNTDDHGRPVAIHIRKKICPVTGERWQPKHGRERIVPLTAKAASILTQAMSASTVPWAFQSPIPNDTQPGMWTYPRMKDRLQARLREVGIAKCGLHRFRHTGATYLANDARVPIVKLQRFLGHGDIKETMRYLNPRAEHVADAIQSVDFDALIDPDNTTGKDADKDTEVDDDADGKK